LKAVEVIAYIYEKARGKEAGMISEQYEVGNFSVFCYLIGDEETGEGLWIDPSDETDFLLSEAKSKGISKIKYIVNTHAHVDHVMGNAKMKKKTGAEIIIHEADADHLLMTPPDLLEMFHAESSPPADLRVKEGDRICAGKIELTVLHTPGHSPGAICLYTKGLVFTGDTLFIGSVGRTDLPGSSWQVLEESIRSKLYTLPGDTIVFPGHNYGSTPTSTIQHERRNNPFVRG
jgi:glyoxylase-like metal-dependent hydrolase (beta-lactamase superfamily II)